MSNNTPLNLRIKFKKVGNLQYISHLDLVRTMHKIVVRSKLPVWYTEGFNPKPKMVFAAPLSIGTESTVEFMDLRMDERVDVERAMEMLNKNMTEEIQVLEAYYPSSKLTDLKWLSYELTIDTPESNQEMVDRCVDALSGESVIVEKKTKSGNSCVDIKPLIKSFDIKLDCGRIRISCVLSADASSFLNPEYIVKYLRAECGMLSSENLISESYTIFRNFAYFDDMTEFR